MEQGDADVVLQFLLGKTSDIRLEDARSVTSTSSSQSSSEDGTSGSTNEKQAASRDDAINEEVQSDTAAGACDAVQADDVASDREVQSDGGLPELLSDDEDNRIVETVNSGDEADLAATDREDTDDERCEGGGNFVAEAHEMPKVIEQEGVSPVPSPEATSCTRHEQQDSPIVSTNEVQMDMNKSATVHEDESEDDCTADSNSSGSKTTAKSKSPPKAAKVQSDRDTGSANDAAFQPSTETVSVARVCRDHPEEEAASKDDPGEPATTELVFVGCVTISLLLYIVACIYSYYHPISALVPDPSQFELAYDISSARVEITRPGAHFAVHPSGVVFEWNLLQYPADALRKFGPEVYQYWITVDGQHAISEIGFLDLVADELNASTCTRTVRHRLPAELFALAAEHHTLRLKVEVPIPGVVGESTVLVEQVVVSQLSTQAQQLSVVSPLNNSRIVQGDDIVVEYQAHRIERLHIVIDDEFRMWKTHVDDGRLLLRGLGEGNHVVTLHGFDDRDAISLSSSVHISITADGQ